MDIFGSFVALTFLMWFLGLAAVVWGLIDVIRVPDDSMFRAGDKLVWVIVILFANVVGVIVYLAIGRPSQGSQRSALPDDNLPPPPVSL